MKFPFFQNIKIQLLFIVFISVLPALGIIIYSGVDRSFREIEHAEHEALEVAKSFAYDIEQSVESTKQFLMTLAKVPEIRHMRVEASNQLLVELLKQNPLYSTLFVVNAQGFLHSSGHLPLPTSPLSLKTRKYFQEAVRRKDFLVGEYEICSAVKKPVLVFSYPILDGEGQFKGIIAVSINFDRYDQRFPRERLPKGSTISLSDHRGRVLYHYHRQGSDRGSLERVEDIKQMSGPFIQGIFRTLGEDRVNLLNSYKRFHLQDDAHPYLYLRIGVPEKTALIPARKALLTNLIFLGIAFVIAVIVALFLGDFMIIRSLNRLVEVSRKLGSGDLKVRSGLNEKDGEFGQLGKAFDEMAEALEARNTEQMHIEEALRESENKFKALAEEAGVGVFLVQDGIFKYLNKRLAEMNGYTVEELLNKKGPKDLVLPEDWPLVEEKIQKRFSDECQAVQYEVRGLTKDNRILHLEVYGSRTLYQGRPALIGTLIDITERKQTEEALLESENKYRSVVENSLAGFYIIQDHLFRFVNQRWCEMLGYSYEEVVDRLNPIEITHPDDKKIVEDHLIRRLTGEAHRIEYDFRTVRKDGQVIHVKVLGSFILYHGRPAATGTMIDITRERTLELQLRQAQKMEAIGTLAGGIAHDFNNLLMTILGYTSLILMNTDPRHPNYEKLKIIESQIQSGADLTNRLLGFARGGKYQVKTTNLNDLLLKTSEIFGRTRKEIHINRDFEKDLWRVDVDRGQMEQVFLNLFVNAWQAMPRGGELHLKTQNVILDEIQCQLYTLKPGRYIKVSVTDTGVGMDEKTKQRAFEPFFTTKGVGKGTGLGLASAYGIIKNHNGTITLYSEKGKGSTFNIYLPASEKAQIEEKTVSDEIVKGAGTILLIDDQEIVLQVGKEMLEALGYKVLSAKSGKEAIEIYKKHQEEIALVILDMIMPVTGGGEIFKALKNINSHIKVILSSGYSLDGQAEKILARGCSGFIQKPFNIRELSKKIREVLDDKGDPSLPKNKR